jgi:NAD(P)-dependent dehydrogenase (short-subunit alcohol dehydrogenase family)
MDGDLMSAPLPDDAAAFPADPAAVAVHGRRLDFTGRTAVVTGAGGNPGLGREYALLLAARGARVVVNDVPGGPDGRESSALAVAREICDAGGEAIAHVGDISTRTGADSAIAAAVDAWGRVDILINNAGVAPPAAFADVSVEDIERVLAVHVMGHIWMCRAAWPWMLNQNYGRIVNISSSTTLSGRLGQPIYIMAKLGIVGLTRALAAEGRTRGILSNALMPLAVTRGRPWAPPKQLTSLVAPVAGFLAHESCDFAGKTITAGGGHVAESFLALTPGLDLPLEEFSLEAVASAIATVVDRSAAIFVDDPDGGLPPA